MFGRKVMYSGKSNYGSYKIVDASYNGRPARVLYGNSNTPQSGSALDDDPELLFNYNQRLLELIKSSQPKRVLVIGGGVLMLPNALHTYFSNMIIDVVEIDELLIDLAYKYFDAPHSDRLTHFISDGKKYLQTTNRSYDVIVLDAFTGHDIPSHLLEREAVLLYKKHLNNEGFVALNLISSVTNPRYTLAKEVITTFEEVFQKTYLFQADTNEELFTEQNMIAVATDTLVDFEYLQSVDIREFL